jgi:uncharacterized FlaG/YvyC family protein
MKNNKITKIYLNYGINEMNNLLKEINRDLNFIINKRKLRAVRNRLRRK